MSSNGYSLYCAELMVNMKDVPSTERMVLCSKQWKMMTQKEKDMFQKRCEQVGSDTLTSQQESPPLIAALSSRLCLLCLSDQRKKQYDIDLQRFLEVRIHQLTPQTTNGRLPSLLRDARLLPQITAFTSQSSTEHT